MLPSPSSLCCNERKKGDSSFGVITFFVALQQNKKRKATTTTSSPSLLHCSKTKKEGIREGTYFKLPLWVLCGSHVNLASGAPKF